MSSSSLAYQYDDFVPITPPGYELRPFQREGVAFLTDEPFPEKFHRLLADDMGLGKTVQAICAMNRIGSHSAVVVCPATVRIHWARAISEWSTIEQRICILRDGKQDIPPLASVIIVSYDLLNNDRIYKQLVTRGERIGFDVVIMDEAHYMKSTATKRTKRVLGKNPLQDIGTVRKSFLFYARYKWCLTGTPVLNRPIELYPMLYTLAPEVIHPYVSFDEYGRYFCNGHKDRKCKKCGEYLKYDDVICSRCKNKSVEEFGMNFKGASHLAELAERLKGFMLRRKKEDVLDQLPPLTITHIDLDVRAPIALEDAPIATVRRELGIAKIPEAASYIHNLSEEVGKVVIFAHHRDVIEGLAETLSELNPVICYGGMTAEKKQVSIDRFVNDPGVKLFLAQTGAGGVGIDGLQKSCSYFVFVEWDWSPGVMDQAIDRLNRMGQKNPVFGYFLSVPDSLDTVMEDVTTYKRHVISQIVKAQEYTNTMSIESQLQEIIDLLKGGAVAAPAVPSAKPAAKPAAKPSAKPVAEDPKPAGKPAALPAKPTGPSAQDVLNAASAFIAATADEEHNKSIINSVIWPKYGATNFKTLKPEFYQSVLEEFEQGPEAFTLSGEGEDMGI
jgi:SWI/SNF-related matrix-associated actin-dependent regulator of chromatin subfamily A-like protein 1